MEQSEMVPTIRINRRLCTKDNQLATALGKTEPDKVLKLKMSAPNQEIYLLIMTCTTTEEIVATINKF